VETAIWILALIATVTAVSAVARRFELPAPLLLVVIGIGASYLPFVEVVELSPELVLVGLLPPLLYAAAIRTSLVDVKANVKSISLLAVGLVIFRQLLLPTSTATEGARASLLTVARRGADVGIAASLLMLSIMIRVIGSWLGAGRYRRGMKPFYFLTDWIVEPIRRRVLAGRQG